MPKDAILLKFISRSWVISFASSSSRALRAIFGRIGSFTLQRDQPELPLHLSHGDCLVIKRKVGVSVGKSFEPEPEPAPYEASPSEFDGLISGGGSDQATEKVSDAQHQEEIADSEAHEGDEDFKDENEEGFYHEECVPAHTIE